MDRIAENHSVSSFDLFTKIMYCQVNINRVDKIKKYRNTKQKSKVMKTNKQIE